MLGGIAFQLLVMIFFSAFGLEYFYRYSKDIPIKGYHITDIKTGPPVAGRNSADSQWFTEKVGQYRGAITTKWKIMAYALVFTTLLLLIRSVI